MPERCVVCNQPAEARRIKRTLYWTPRAWRYTSMALLAGSFAVGAWMMDSLAIFGWTILLVLVVHLVLRKSLKIEITVCAPHRRRRNLLRALSLACIVLLVGSFFIVRGNTFNLAIALMMSSAVASLVLGIVQSLIGIQAIRLQELAEGHAWFSGTGTAFRETLPELH
jgi:hypothetical protein